MQGPRQNQRGQSLVELAISFTVLLILLGGAIDLGRAFFAYIAVRDAAQEGATYGALHPADTIGVEQRVRHSASGPINLTSTTEVIVTSSPDPSNGYYQVTVQYNFKPMMPIMSVIMGPGTFPLRATVTQTILSY